MEWHEADPGEGHPQAFHHLGGFVCLFVVFLGLHLPHMEVPRLGVESEQHLPSHSNTGSELHLQPTPQLTEILDP